MRQVDPVPGLTGTVDDVSRDLISRGVERAPGDVDLIPGVEGSLPVPVKEISRDRAVRVVQQNPVLTTRTDRVTYDLVTLRAACNVNPAPGV
jgi:hypothetical protein